MGAGQGKARRAKAVTTIADENALFQKDEGKVKEIISSIWDRLENKKAVMTGNYPNDRIALFLKAAEECEGNVYVDVLPVGSEEEAAVAAGVFDSFYLSSGTINRGRLGGAQMAKYMFSSRDERSPIVISYNDPSGKKDLSFFWNKVKNTEPFIDIERVEF